jgi:putative membrane protein
MNDETHEKRPDVAPAPSLAPVPAECKTGIRAILTGMAAAWGTGPAWVQEILEGFAAALGIGANRIRKPADGATDISTLLAHERTDLAMERTYWAAERTLMGWIRTALSMISFGFTIGKIGQVVEDIEVRGLKGMHMISVSTIAYILVLIGTISLLAAAVQYSRRVRELCESGLQRQPSMAFAVALILTILGVIAFSALVMNL